MSKLINLSRIPLQCVRTIAPERGWGGHFHTFTVFLSTPSSTRCHCLLECGKGLLDESVKIRDDVVLNMSSLCRILRWWCIQAFCFGVFTSLSFFKIFFPLVFMILFVDTGGWSSWSNFGPCYEDSYKCLHDRQRYCSHKNRNKCPGANKYGVQKQTKPCPHSCSSKYNKWSKSRSLRQNM